MFKRGSTALLLIGAVALATGCAGADHSWRGEFDARLEGASAAIEETLAVTRPNMSEIELGRTYYFLGRQLLFKSELIKKLEPPDGCEEVQEGGWREVGGIAQFDYELLKNLTPYLKNNLRRDVREQVGELRQIQAKSRTCA